MPETGDAQPQAQNPAAAALQDKFNQGMALHQQGRLAEAERIYREVLQQQPNHFGALHLLGAIALQTGHTEQGFKLIGEAIRNPDFRESPIRLDWKKNDIEVDVSPNTLTALIRHVEANWLLLGEREPYWSVLTDEKYKAKVIGSNIKEFYASGKNNVSNFTHAADRAGVDYRNLRRCFELGCGVGRMTIWLARIFPELVAVDISKSHLRLAAEVLEREGLTNVDLRLVNTIDKIETLPAFDCFVSIIVLQHNPPPVMAFLLRTILGKLKPGGLAYFQVPTYQVDAVFYADQYLANKTIGGDMEMHVLPQAVIWQLADEADCQLLDIREDGLTGIPKSVSNSILLMKRV
jgi:SAM-dependent methyltransferase